MPKLGEAKLLEELERKLAGSRLTEDATAGWKRKFLVEKLEGRLQANKLQVPAASKPIEMACRGETESKHEMRSVYFFY